MVNVYSVRFTQSHSNKIIHLNYPENAFIFTFLISVTHMLTFS